MTKKEEMEALRADPEKHYNCTQSLLIPYAEELGITKEQAAALGAHFGSGMGCGSVCGAITGALMVMGSLGVPVSARAELFRRFREKNGDVDCAPLLRSAAQRGEERFVHCGRLVEECMDYLEEIIGKE